VEQHLKAAQQMGSAKDAGKTEKRETYPVRAEPGK
jgi:hypothetical protein